MKKVAIAIDPWKLDSFKSGLELAGYGYTIHEGVVLTVIKVDVDDLDVLTTFKALIQRLNSITRSVN